MTEAVDWKLPKFVLHLEEDQTLAAPSIERDIVSAIVSAGTTSANGDGRVPKCSGKTVQAMQCTRHLRPTSCMQCVWPTNMTGLSVVVQVLRQPQHDDAKDVQTS